MKTGIAGVLLLSAAVVGAANDWPRWQGPDGTRISRETGLLKEWPASGPRRIWTASGLGSGYGSMAVAGDRVLLQGLRGAESVGIARNRRDGRGVRATLHRPTE